VVDVAGAPVVGVVADPVTAELEAELGPGSANTK